MPITVTPVNDVPTFNNIGTTVAFQMAGAAVVIDPDISIADIEIDASGTFDGTTISLTRTNADDYAPSPQFFSNPTDRFSSSAQPGNLVEGSVISDGLGVFGTVTTNSGGLLVMAFDANATKARIEALLQSVEYQNTSNWPADINGWPHDHVVLEWTFNDNGIRDDGSSDPTQNQIGIGYSHIDITTTDSQPQLVLNEDLYINVGSQDKILDRINLTYVDVDTTDSALVYEITNITGNVTVKKNGMVLNTGDTFTQEDLHLGVITVSTTENKAQTENIDFTVTGHSGSVNGTVIVDITDDGPSALRSGIQLNLDGGNDAFLGDTGQFHFKDGFDNFTYEFTFSQLQVNPGDLESTLYSGISTTSPYANHYERLVIVPITGTNDGIIEWHNELYDPAIGVPTISATVTDIFDGGLHSVAFSFEMKSGGTVELFYDGAKVATAPNNWSGSSVVWGGGFPWVIGQQLMHGSVFSGGLFDGYIFDQGKHFSGTLHELRIWDDLRSDNEISDHYLARWDNDPDEKDKLIVDWHMHDADGDYTISQVNDTTPTLGPAGEEQPVLQVGHASGSGFLTSTPSDELRIVEGSSNGTVAGYLMPMDWNPDKTGFTYEVLDIGNISPFDIDSTTGRVTLTDASLITPDMTLFDLRIKVTSTEKADTYWTETVPVHILTINDAPVIDVSTNANVAFTEGDLPVLVNPTITVQDEELEATSFQGAIITLERYDTLGAAPDPQPEDQFSSYLFSGGSPAFTVDQTSSRLQVTFNAGATATDVNQLMQSIKYQNTSDNPQSTVTLQWTFSDGNTGDAQGFGGEKSDIKYTTVNITPVNDSPVLTTPSNPFGSTNEDIDFEITGADLTAYSSDVDGSIASYTVTNVVNGTISVVAGATVLDDKIIWSPPADTSGTFHAFDILATDDSGADSVVRSVYINVVSVSDTPTGTDSSVSLNEDTPLTLNRAHFGFSDVDSDTFDSVVIAGVTSGTVLLNGLTVIAPTSISIADFDAGNVEFVPNSNLHNQSAQIEFQVVDSGTNNTDPTPNTLTIALNPVNDAPATADVTRTTLEDTQLSFSTADFAFSDADDVSGTKPTGDSPYSVILTSIPVNGTLTLNGITLSSGDAILFSEIDTGLKYQPLPDSTIGEHFDFQVRDDGSVSNGGVDKSAVHRVSISITPVNDAPQGTDNTISVLEGTNVIF
ncbi:MAG: cadherin-like domain-containing protein, partial [Pseudomonadota bacterium]